MFNILLIDDDRMFMQGLRYLLNELKPDIVFQEAVNLEQARAIENTESVDLVILDYYFRNSQIEGLDAVKQVSQLFGHSTIVVLSGASYTEDTERKLNIDDLRVAGASGFISKSSSQDTLINAIPLSS